MTGFTLQGEFIAIKSLHVAVLGLPKSLHMAALRLQGRLFSFKTHPLPSIPFLVLLSGKLLNAT